MHHQKQRREEVIIFSRYPQPGITKTRLIPELGTEGAARIQRFMTERIVRRAISLARERCLSLFIYYTGGSSRLMRQWLGSDLDYLQQQGDDLGMRMRRAFLDSRERGAERSIIVGSDCPALQNNLMVEALNILQTDSLVLGPAVDGGYYLIGTNTGLPAEKLARLFTAIPWGTPEVLPATMERAAQAGITPVLLQQLHDIDLPNDLAHFDHYSDSQ